MDTSQLTKSTIVNAFTRANLRYLCPIYNPVQFKPGINYNEIEEHAYRGDFHCLVPQYEREAETFELSQRNFAVFDRFVQLLAPLTLHLFRTSSKHVYYECLDIRGLDTRTNQFARRWKNCFSVGDGFVTTVKNLHNPWDNQLAQYQICHGKLIFASWDYCSGFSTLNFVKKYKTIDLRLYDELFLDKIDDFCDAVFHPGVEHVEVWFRREIDDVPSADWLKNYGIFLGYCKSTRTCHFDHYGTEPMSLEMKKLIEEWAVTAVNLEVFIYKDSNGYCQMHEGKLKYCYEIDGEAYLFDSIKNLKKWELNWKDHQVPEHHRYIRYEDAVAPFRETLNPRMVTVEATQIKTAEPASESDEKQLATNGGGAAQDGIQLPSAALNGLMDKLANIEKMLVDVKSQLAELQQGGMKVEVQQPVNVPPASTLPPTASKSAESVKPSVSNTSVSTAVSAKTGEVAPKNEPETPKAAAKSDSQVSVANNKSGPKNDVKKDQNQKKPVVPQTQNQKNNQNNNQKKNVGQPNNNQNKNAGQQNNQAKTVAPANQNQNQQNKRKNTAKPAASVSPAKRARVPYPVSQAVNPFQRNNQNQQAKKQTPSLVRMQNQNAAGYGRQQQQQFRQQQQQPFQQPYVEAVPPWHGSQYPPAAVAVTPGYGGHGYFPQPQQVLQIPQQQQIPPPHNPFGPGNYPPMQQRTWR